MTISKLTDDLKISSMKGTNITERINRTTSNDRRCY